MGILEERRKRRIANLLRQQQDMAKYNQNKNSLLDAGKQAYEISGNVNQIGEGVNKLGKNFGNDKLANVGSKIQNISGRPALNNAKATLAKNLGLSSGVGSAGTAGASMAGTTGVGGSAIANGIASAVPSATTTAGTLASGAGAGATGLAGAGATTAGTASSALGSSALGSSLLGATGGASAGAMGTAGATSALSGATAGATAGAGAGMGAGATALGMAGPIGAALLAGYAIYNMVKSAKAKKNAKAMQKDMEAMNNNEQLANQNKAEMQNNFAQGAQNNIAQLDNETQAQLDPTGSMDMEMQDAITNGEPTGFATPVPNYGQMVQDAIAKQTQQTVPSTIQEPDAFTNIEAGVNNVPQTTLVDNSTIADNIASQAPVEDKKSGILAKLTDMAGDFKEGFNENVSEGFSPENLRADKAKSIMNRVGELAGTGVRTLGKPGVQGLIAGGISRAQGNDWGNAIATGVDYAQKRQVADHYYKALNPDAKFTPLFSGLGADDYKAVTGADYKVGQLANQRARIEAQLDKSNPKAIDHANIMLGTGQWSLDDYNNFLKQFPDKEQRISLESLKQGTNEFKAENQNTHWQNMDAIASQRNAIIAQRNADIKALTQQRYALEQQKINNQISDEAFDREAKIIDQQLSKARILASLYNSNMTDEQIQTIEKSIDFGNDPLYLGI